MTDRQGDDNADVQEKPIFVFTQPTRIASRAQSISLRDGVQQFSSWDQSERPFGGSTPGSDVLSDDWDDDLEGEGG